MLATPTNLPFFFPSTTLSLALSSIHFPQHCSSIFPTLSSKSGRNYPFSPGPFLSGYNESPVTHFLWLMIWSMSWPDEVLCFSHIQSYVVYLLLPLVSTLFFSQPRGILSHLSSFDTQVSSVCNEKLELPCHTSCVLYHLCCDKQSPLLNFYLSRIGRIENPLCSACGHLTQDIPHLILQQTH